VGTSWVTWGQQHAFGATRQLNKHPKVVAIMTDPQLVQNEDYAPEWINTWKKAGAETVYVDPVALSSGDCSSLVLRYRNLGVEYWDFGSFGWLLCAAAEQRLGWKPPLGQGGVMNGPLEFSDSIGQWMDGSTTAGTSDMANGSPRFPGPQPAHREYVEAISKYHSKQATYQKLNSTIMPTYWIVTKFLVAALDGAAKEYREISQEAVLKWIYKTENYDLGLAPPVPGWKANCKRGLPTWWGLYKWDPNRKERTDGNFYKVEQKPYADNSWYTDDPCYDTNLADKLLGVKK
jgi:hypothetical protein